MAQMKKLAGCIYLAPVNEAGEVTGDWETPGEANPLEISTSEEVTKISGMTCTTFGKTVATIQGKSEAGGKMTLHEYKPANVAKALRALISENTKAQETLTDKEITLSQLGHFVEIGNEDLTNIVIKDSTTAANELVEGVDYEINDTLGLIAPLKQTLAGKKVKVSAISAKGNGVILSIGAGKSAKYALKGKLIDINSGRQEKIYLRKVLISSSGGVVFNSEEGTSYEKLEFELTPEIPPGQKDYGSWGIPA